MFHAFVLLHCGVLLAGFTGILGRLIELNSTWLVFYRLLFSVMAMAVYGYIFQRKLHLTWRQIIKIAAVGIILTISMLFFYASIKYANVSIAVICFALNGFFAATLVPVIAKRNFYLNELLLSLLTVFGVGLIFSFDASLRLGIILGVLAALFSAITSIYNEQLTREFNIYTLTFYEMAGGLVALVAALPLISYYIPSNYIIPHARDTFYLLLLAVLCTVIMQLLINTSLKKLSAFTISIAFNLEPVYSIALAMLLFHEYRELNFAFYLGLILIFSSLALQTYRTTLTQQPKSN